MSEFLFILLGYVGAFLVMYVKPLENACTSF